MSSLGYWFSYLYFTVDYESFGLLNTHIYIHQPLWRILLFLWDPPALLSAELGGEALSTSVWWNLEHLLLQLLPPPWRSEGTKEMWSRAALGGSRELSGASCSPSACPPATALPCQRAGEEKWKLRVPQHRQPLKRTFLLTGESVGAALSPVNRSARLKKLMLTSFKYYFMKVYFHPFRF